MADKPESHVRTAKMAKQAAKFEKQREKELAAARKVHAKRGVGADVQGRVSAELPKHR